MPRPQNRWKSIGLLIGIAALTGCTASPDNEEAVGAADEASLSTPAPASEEQESIRFYIQKLPDRDYVETYGDAENPRPWYSAAEALGEIGKAAIPALIERLDTQDPYELKLALYALMLASQDPILQAETKGNYLRLGTVLTEETNEENRQLALEWWERYRHLWQ